MKIKNPVVIGDIHANYKGLKRILKQLYIIKYESPRKSSYLRGDTNRSSLTFGEKTSHWKNPKEYQLIFLGDINDGRSKGKSSFKTLLLIKDLVDSGIGLLVQSNHQADLIKAWFSPSLLSKGKESQSYKELLYLKIKDPTTRDAIEELIHWLNQRPFYISFVLKDKEYICVHAYYTPGMDKYNPTPEERNGALYGAKRQENGNKNEWWLTYTKPPFIFAGHYHTLFKSDYCLIIDGNSGTEDGRLYAYILNEDKFIHD